MPGSVPHKSRECQIQADHIPRQSQHGLVIYTISFSRRIKYTFDEITHCSIKTETNTKIMHIWIDTHTPLHTTAAASNTTKNNSEYLETHTNITKQNTTILQINVKCPKNKSEKLNTSHIRHQHNTRTKSHKHRNYYITSQYKRTENTNMEEVLMSTHSHDP